MKYPTLERILLLHELWERKLSDDTVDIVADIVARTRIEQGHLEAEAISKEIHEILDTGISESELIRKLKGEYL